MKENKLPDFDVAVIGGGASGIYTAWRMLLEGDQYSEKIKKWTTERGHLKIAIFEGSDRIGGRVLSAKAPGLNDVICEIGGMRYVDSQVLVKSLVENKLKLDTTEQSVTESNNLAYLRAKRLRQSDLGDPSEIPYQINDEEKAWLKTGNSADNFLGYAVEKIFPEIVSESLTGDKLRAWLGKQTVNGTPLYKIGFWNLIAPVLSHEAYKIAITTVGYDCLGFNTNAVDTICELYDFVPGVKYYLLDKGYEYMLYTMQQEFEEKGGQVLFNKWLKSFDELKLDDGSAGVELQFKNEAKPKSARAIVLAMPQRSLDLLDRTGPVMDEVKAPHFRYLMNSVEPVQLYKMFLAYDTPWWEKTNDVSSGRSLTDIPVRQCYYWGKVEDDPNNTNAMLMVYNDALSSTFWGGLRHIPLGPGDTVSEFSHNRNFVRKPMNGVMEKEENVDSWDAQLKENWKNHEAPHDMVHEMHRQVMEMHGVTDVPEPMEAAFKDWADDPFGGAVHFWNVGYDSSKVLKQIIHPVKGFPCYICGEAYSTNQTWIEGAFQTAELVLRKFGIPLPSWVSPDQIKNKHQLLEHTEK